jgi:hypothetical protein
MWQGIERFEYLKEALEIPISQPKTGNHHPFVRIRAYADELTP